MFVGYHLISLVKRNYLYPAFEEVHPNVKLWEETISVLYKTIDQNSRASGIYILATVAILKH